MQNPRLIRLSSQTNSALTQDATRQLFAYVAAPQPDAPNQFMPRLEQLKADGADFQATDERGRNLIYYAIRSQQPEMLEAVLRLGADPFVQLPRDAFFEGQSGLLSYLGYVVFADSSIIPAQKKPEFVVSLFKRGVASYHMQLQHEMKNGVPKMVHIGGVTRFFTEWHGGKEIAPIEDGAFADYMSELNGKRQQWIHDCEEWLNNPAQEPPHSKLEVCDLLELYGYTRSIDIRDHPQWKQHAAQFTAASAMGFAPVATVNALRDVFQPRLWVGQEAKLTELFMLSPAHIQQEMLAVAAPLLMHRALNYQVQVPVANWQAGVQSNATEASR